MSKPVNCSLSVYSFNGTLGFEVYYGDGSGSNSTLVQSEIFIIKTYGAVGVFTITLRIPSKELEFNQTVRIHGNLENYSFPLIRLNVLKNIINLQIEHSQKRNMFIVLI